MSLATIITGVAIDMGKKFLFEKGKQVAHEFGESAGGKKAGIIINYRRQENYNNVLLFVHGFSGSSSETFGFTPDLLINEVTFKGWDIFSVGYSTDIFPAIGKGLWSVNPDINKVAMYLNTLLKNQFADYERIAFVGHSMGGLAVQRAILNAGIEMQDKISHVIFFGTPSAGLKKAGWVNWWNKQLKDLDEASPFIKDLRTDWNNTYKDGMKFVFKTIAGSKDEFVPVTSSLEPFDEKYRGVIEGNHISMVKPTGAGDVENQSFQIILKTLTAQHIEYMQGDPEEINLLLGQYQTVINKLLPNANKLITRALIQLVFALECTGRGKEALNILNQYPDAANDSDILGVIGGRHKRNFLLSGLKDDAVNAFNYYERGLGIAEKEQHSSQIFYHAINLAFLNINARSNKNAMKEMAQKALSNCDPNSGNIWEIATIAEANMYLGDKEKAIEYYTKAGLSADARQKESIYSNAYYGYQSLMEGKTDNDPFVKSLGNIFLKK